MKNEILRQQRITLMEALYQYDIYTDQKLEFTPIIETEDVLERYESIIAKLQDIDTLIEKFLFNYRLNRLSFVDRAIIRLAVFELLEKETAAAIIIDEAIELTKIYTNLDDEKQHKFNNKLLDAIYQSLKD